MNVWRGLWRDLWIGSRNKSLDAGRSDGGAPLFMGSMTGLYNGLGEFGYQPYTDSGLGLSMAPIGKAAAYAPHLSHMCALPGAQKEKCPEYRGI